ncbi:GNAT family N-acetyltransferase [Micromonospora sp. NPDC050397]|uniref:GNAT family N-acetyltransferase n=1 Tax=Micromonospora sp. NPDC050397 TaxID=3364279 RepID=UPI00384CCB48
MDTAATPVGIAVIPLDVADDLAVEQAFALRAAIIAADLPDFPPFCRQRFLGQLRHPMPGEEDRFALAYLDGEPVGFLCVELPQLENTENASVSIEVLPEYRRRGVGRTLHEYAVRTLRELGRRRLNGHSVDVLPGQASGPDPVAAFAASVGAKNALVDVRRRLDITTLDHLGLDELLAEAWRRADGYSLVQWTGSAPDEYLDDIAYLDGRLIQDAPLGDLEWEAAKPDRERILAVDAALAARGRRSYHSGLRHDATGRLVAWTMIDLGASVSWHAYQQITIVDPDHRGHRLGTVAKVENLRFTMAHEAELRFIDTWNAGVNDHMISINEAIGFRPVDSWNNWQLTL